MPALPLLGTPPALSLSLRYQTRARLRRLQQSFATPRRIFLTITAVLLACVWLGNVVLSLLFREPYDPAALGEWLRVGLTVYALWHFIRTAWERPLQGLEWTPSEEQFLVSGPFTRRQLVQYRLMTVGASAVLKATIATLLLLPDLSAPWLSLLALCLALFTVELIRIGLDTLTAAMKPAEYSAYRTLVLALAGAAVVWVLQESIERWTRQPPTHLPPMVRLFSVTLQSVQASAHTEGFQALSSGFQVFVGLTTAHAANWGVLGQLLAAAAVAGLLTEFVLQLDAACQRRQRTLEGEELHHARAAQDDDAASHPRGLPSVFLGPVAWRQFCGMRLHLTGVLLALVAPAMLSLIPFVLFEQGVNDAFVNFVASLAFYTLLLLPPALKFDFRRDYDRLLALKMLPASPLRVTLGQIAVPVLVSTVFQWTLVLLAYLVRPVAPGYVLAALALFVPVNLAIFGIDNLLFLMFPHRLQQEGLDVFLRTTLVFTAKGVIFGVMLVGVVIWSAAARALSESLVSAGVEWCQPMLVFGLGLWALALATAGSAVGLTASAFRHFDPSRGMVA